MITLRNLCSGLILIIATLSVSIVQAKTVSDLLHKQHDPIRGNLKGNVTIVEFFDYQCSHCSSMAPVVDAILKNNPNVRVIYKEFPIRGPLSELASRAALAANKQGKYGEFSHALLAVAANQPLTEEIIYHTAKQTGINVTMLKKDMHSKLINGQLNGNYELAKTLKLFATPTFYVGKTAANSLTEVASTVGELSQPELQAMIDRAAQ